MEVKNNLIELEVVYSKLNKQIDENISKLQAGAVAVDNYNKKISVVPSEFQKSLTDIKAKTDAITQSNKQLEASERKLQQERIKELQLQKQREQAIDKYNAQLAKEQRLLEASESLYNKVQNKLNSLSNEYKALAVRKELGLSLTAKEEQRYSTLQGRIQKYDQTLKAVDATIGKHQRNVGNYTSAFNPLQNSINQLGREMPAFANSVQTGFMAISNNLPIFFDAITQTKNEIKSLRAEGKQVPSLFSQLTSSLLSWGTALSVGVTLLTVYGKEMVSFVMSLFEGSKALKELAENQKAFNESRNQGIKESIAERGEVDKNVKVMRNSNLELEKRKIALNNLRNQYPLYFKDLTDEQMLNGNITVVMRQLNQALKDRAQLNKATEANVKNKERLFDLQEELKNQKELLIIAKKREEEGRKQANNGGSAIGGTSNLANESRTAKIKAEILKIEKDILAFQKAIASNDLVINDLKGKQIELEGSLNKEKDKSNKNAKEKINLQKEEIKSVNELIKLKDKEREAQIGSLEWLKQNISAKEAERDSYAKGSDEYDRASGGLKFYQDWLELVYGSTKKTTQATDDFIKKFKEGIVNSFIDQSGFDKLFFLIENFDKLKESGVATGLAISEAFQQAFNTISEASQKNFDAEYARLEQQRDFAIEMAGGSATAREEIERQYDERKKQIQRREAESQKRLALFNIAINTAQAIVAALPNIPLSIAIGVIGAVQAGLVASQEIPQFWKGTDNAPEGVAWTQEKGAEVITDKSGNVKTLGSNKGAQLTYLSKGDKVYKSHEDYINKVLSKNGVEPLGTYLNIPMQQNNAIDMQEMKQEFSKLANVIKNKDGVNISIDERGFRKAQGNTEFLNARMNLKSRVI